MLNSFQTCSPARNCGTTESKMQVYFNLYFTKFSLPAGVVI